MDLSVLPSAALSPARIVRTWTPRSRASSSRAAIWVGTGGLLPTHNSFGLKLRSTAGQAAHVVRVRMAQRDDIEMANAARPEHWRNHLFANVEVLGGPAADAPPNPTAIHSMVLAIGRDEQQRISLAHVDGFDKQRIMWMIDGTRHDHHD